MEKKLILIINLNVEYLEKWIIFTIQVVTMHSIRSDDPSSAGDESAKIQPGMNSKNIKDRW